MSPCTYSISLLSTCTYIIFLQSTASCDLNCRHLAPTAFFCCSCTHYTQTAFFCSQRIATTFSAANSQLLHFLQSTHTPTAFSAVIRQLQHSTAFSAVDSHSHTYNIFCGQQPARLFFCSQPPTHTTSHFSAVNSQLGFFCSQQPAMTFSAVNHPHLH